MSSEKETNNSEKRITIDKPEENTGKSKARVEAGKRLAEYNKAMRKKKESGETCEKPERPEESVRENNDSNDGEMDWVTGVLTFLGLAGLGYYFYTTTGDSKKEVEVVKKKSNVVQNNNNNEYVQENSVSRLRSFKN